MPYRMPRARMEAGTVIDREVLDRMLQDPASKLAAGLNEHDINYATCLTETPDPGVFYTWQSARKVTDPWITHAGVPEPGGNGPDASFVVCDSRQWEKVTSVNATVTTDGDSALWICVHVVYALQEWTWIVPGTPPCDLAPFAAKIQIGIRVDGVLLHTWTGRREENEWDFAAVKPDDPKSQTIGAKVIRLTRTNAVGPHFFCIRDIVPAFVQSGVHTVELVCRRSKDNYTIRWVEFYNRKLFCLELPISGRTQPAGQAPNLVSLEDGDVFSALNIHTNRLVALRNAYNAVLSGDIRRGGLNHAHYPTALLASSQGTITTGNTCAHVYPGFGSNLQDPADPGWWRVVNAGFGHLLTDNGGGGWTGTAGSLLLVLAQVHVVKIDNADPDDDDINDFGCFTLMKRVGGVWAQMNDAAPGEAESYVNACAFLGSGIYPKAATPMSGDINLEVTLFDWMTLSVATQSVGVWVSAYGSHGPTVAWDRGSIQALHLRPQT